MNKEQWASRLGVVLAVAGNAMGWEFSPLSRLAAAEYGGGSFLIPYFIALFVLGIPSCGWNGAWGDMEGFLATTRHRGCLEG